jgi:uracil phosphoribosyltransferase
MKALEIKHPLIKHKLTHLRKESTNSKEFKEYLNEITSLMAFEVFRDLKLKDIVIDTPIIKNFKTQELGEEVFAVPILRAGLGMVEGLLHLLPTIKVGHIGIYRDEKTKEAHEYYFKVPKGIEKGKVVLVDPMLASGVSAIYAIKKLKEIGCKDIIFLVLVAAPEGIAVVEKEFPDVQIYTASIDEKLNENKYIVPGLGDAGDRIFGTK